jgi:hypothetical protein
MKNYFDPKTDKKENIPKTSGNYILCLKNNSNLPTLLIKPTFKNLKALRVIYTGEGSILRDRYEQHFEQNNAGRSTIRKSLGVLLGYKQIPRDNNLNNRKTKFSDSDEQKLTDWMRENLIFFFSPSTNYNNIENKLIAYFNPPLNLKGNNNEINATFRKELSKSRSKK